jgi:ParD-like antitoxin of type II bacterial toxin-antitoxin system
MSQPVKLSDGLVFDARLTGEAMQRSIAGQVEFWARLGRSVESLLEGRQVLELCRKGAARPISECLESVDTPAGRQRVGAYLKAGPFPQYQQHPDRPGLLIRIDENGTKTTGRFIQRQFRPIDEASRGRKKAKR